MASHPAPRAAAWQQRLRNLPAPQMGASQSIGTSLCPDELGAGAKFVVEIAFGAVLSNPSSTWTWTDVTSDVQQADGQYVNISPLGRPDETTQSPPAGCMFQLDNRQNLYSKNNPLCSNWPNVKNNTPVRVRVTMDDWVTWTAFFWGEITVWQPGWDVTGAYAVTNITARGRIQRLNQHSNPLKSAIYRSIASTAPKIYFPMDDGADATVAGSAVDGRSAYKFTGISVTFGTDAPAGGTGSVDVVNTLTTAAPYVVSPSFSSGTVGDSFTFAFWMKATGVSASFSSPILSIQTPGSANAVLWGLWVGNNPGFPMELDAINSAGATIFGFSFGGGMSPAPNPLDGSWHLISIKVEQASSTAVNVYGRIDNQTENFLNQSTFNIAPVTGIRIGRIPNRTVSGTATSFLVSSLAMWGATTVPDLYNAGIGWAGETPQARMIRLCDEEGVEFQTIGYYTTDTTMGPQGIDSFMNLIRECETTDDGFLFDGISAGLSYQGPSQRYDQAISLLLDITEVVPVFEPIDDDQRTINKMTVSQKNGSSAVSEVTTGALGTGPDGIGVCDSSITVNPANADRLAYRASWETWKGTVGGFRYPYLYLNFRRRPNLASRFMSQANGWSGAVLPGMRIDLLNTSSYATQHPPGTIPLMVEGFSSLRISKFMFEVDLVCSLNRRYDIQKVGDSQLGRAQTAGSSLATDAPAGSTSLSVATQSGSVVWTTSAANPGDFPMYVEADGIKVTVSAITGSTSPQTFTVDGATVTKPLLAGRYVKVWQGGVIKF